MSIMIKTGSEVKFVYHPVAISTKYISNSVFKQHILYSDKVAHNELLPLGLHCLPCI